MMFDVISTRQLSNNRSVRRLNFLKNRGHQNMDDATAPLTFDKRKAHALVGCQGEECRHLLICYRELSTCLSCGRLRLHPCTDGVSRNVFNRYRKMHFRSDRDLSTLPSTALSTRVGFKRIGELRKIIARQSITR